MNCKKCGKPLPVGHKGKLCEHCNGEKAHGIKKFATNTVIPILSLGLLVITRGRFNLGKK